MKEFKQLGAYGLILDDNKILLIKKNGGPYNGQLDLPGGTIEFCEKPSEALKRELLEEAGIKVDKYELFDANSVAFEWEFKKDTTFKVHHIGVFYKVLQYKNNIKEDIEIDEINNDSCGAKFYDIQTLSKKDLSAIALLELNKLGYEVK